MRDPHERVRELLLGLALIAAAIGAGLARAPVTSWIASGGTPEPQRALRGGTAGENPRVARPLRVVLLDGLSRADTPRLPALEALCAGGLDLTVDVGFPTRSLPVQRVLWSGLTSQQQGDRADNEPRTAPPSSVPLLVPSLAVAESHAEIARDAGFAMVEPIAPADDVDPAADPTAVAAWRAGGFAATAALSVAGPAPLVLVHVLAIDVAAHRHGRQGEAYAASLASADALLATVRAAAPDAQWLVLADHGHRSGGGHGDAEDEVRRVRACWSPVPGGLEDAPRGAEVHLVDVSRWIADAVGAPRHPRAVGRTLAVAVAHPDPDATLPSPGWVRTALALAIALAALVGGLWIAPRRAVVAWPYLVAAVVVAVHGNPTLSWPAPTLLTVGIAAIAAGASLGWVVHDASSVRRAIAAHLTPLGGAVLALSVISRMPAPTPGWTGWLGASALIAVGGVFGAGIALCARSARS